ncbi:NADPH-dependent diflavin oxidoreductase 1 [Taenia crassiceps]|uniref:NADPH-dependent diflavin oxidoreductase 1 n=1 Tax=Taenia crassiceps TaxID=6207 RepID=A0ABR4QJY1_9CEST
MGAQLWQFSSSSQTVASSEKAFTTPLCFHPYAAMGPSFRIVIIYGSQTGTARGIAERLALQCCKLLRLRNYPADCPTSLIHLCCANDYTPLQQLAHEPGPVVFVCSTTGCGDPPDNMATFWRKLMNVRLPEGRTFPTSLRFAVLGVGDSSYKHYNYVAKKLYRRMVHLGASPLPVSMALADAEQDIGLGLADESAAEGLVACFQRFMPSLWNTVLNHYSNSVQPIGSLAFPITWDALESSEFIASLQPRFLVRRVRKIECGELNLINGNHYRNEDVLMDMIETTVARDDALFKIPAMPSAATWFLIKANERITPNNYYQDTRLIKLEAENKDLSLDFLPGCVLQVQPRNLAEDVLAFFKVTGLDPNVRISVRTLTKELHPGQHIVSFTLPGRLEQVCSSDGISLAWLATHYFDLNSIPTRTFFSEFAAAHKWRPTGTKNDERVAMEYDRLKELGQACTPDAVDDFYDYVNRPRRNLIEVLGDFPCTTSFIPAEQWINILPGPPLSRPYSIASASPTIELLIAVVTYRTRMLTPRRGLATTYLARSNVGTRVSAWISRPSYGFDFSYNLSSVPRPPPCILIGPGTGVAPFRAFIQYQHKSSPQAFNVLFFGCRFSHRDFYFEEEWRALETKGCLKLVTAFSREGGRLTTAKNRTYVQHRIRENPDLVWSVLGEAQGSVFIAGNAKTMPAAVREAIVEAAQTGGGLSEYEAESFVSNLESSGSVCNFYPLAALDFINTSIFKEIRCQRSYLVASLAYESSFAYLLVFGPYHDQALRRQKISAAMGGRRGSSSQIAESSHRSSLEHSSMAYPYVNILNLFGQIWLLNVLVVLVLWLFSNIFSSIGQSTIGQWFWRFLIVRCICAFSSCLFGGLTFTLTTVVSLVHIKRICDAITTVRQQRFSVGCRSTEGASRRPRENSIVQSLNGTSSAAASSSAPITTFTVAAASYGIGKQLMDCVYSMVFFLMYRGQWVLLTILLPHSFSKIIIHSVTLGFTYACYAFEYCARQTSNVTAEILLTQVISYWPVFVGYGLPLGALDALSSVSIWSELLFAVLYPILVVGAFQVSWSKALDPKHHRVPPRLRSLAALSMKPALYSTNILISLFASRLSYRFTLSHRSTSKPDSVQL